MSHEARSIPNSRRTWWRGPALIAIVVAMATVAVAISRGKHSRDAGPRLRHTVARGDLDVTVIEQGTLESSENTEIKCEVRGQNTVIWVIESGSQVQAGDELVRLDTLFIEEQIAERSKYAHWSRSAAERSKADVTRAELAISEYLEGRYLSSLATMEKDLAIAESNLLTSKNMLEHAQRMSERGYVSALEVEEKEFSVTQSSLDVDVKKTQIDVLKRFTKAMELETLRGNLAANRARHEADKERAYADAHRRDRALEELEHCVVKAEKSGLVIYPSAAAWKNAPDIEEGATVHQDQVLLLMPDLSKMQVKVGIHESVIDRVKPGLTALVTVPDRTLQGEVVSVASVTSPAGWWTGNVVKYETIIQLPSVEGLKPGMSAEVEVILARHKDVLMVPVSSVLETSEGAFCWVKTSGQPQRRAVTLGDTNDIFIIVDSGLEEGNEVILNPLALIDEAQRDVLKPQQEAVQENEQGNVSESTKTQPSG